MADTYEAALNKAKAELSELVQQRKQLEERIDQLNKSVEALSALVDGKDHSAGLPHLDLPDSAGITDAIREILKVHAMPMGAPSIRDALLAEGFDAKDYSNLLTVIHNTLKRLESQGEVYKVRTPLGGFMGWTVRRSLPRLDAVTKAKDLELDADRLPPEIAGLVSKGKKK